MRVRRVLSFLALTPLVLVGLNATSGGAVAPPDVDGRVGFGSWSPLTSSASPNFAEASVARTADGVLHAVWLVDNADRTHNYEHTTISRSGVQGPVTRVLATNWSQLSTPVDLGVNPDGSLRLAFTGTIDGDTSNFFTYKGVYTAVSADGGATWVVPREVLAPSISSGGVTLAYTPDGNTITGFGDTGGFHWHVGSVPEAAVPTATNQEFTDHDAVAPSLVRSGAAVYVVYQSFRGGGVFARQVWPTLGAAVRAPGSNNDAGGTMAVVDRAGVGPVAAYTSDSRVVLWDIVDNRTYRVRGMDGATNVALAATTDEHLWVAAQGPIGYQPRASRVAVDGWATDRRPARLDDLYNTFGIALGTSNPLRAELLVTGNDSGDASRIHAQSVRAQLTLRAAPRRWGAGEDRRVVFRVTDVDGALAGARVRAAGATCRTTASGRCTIRFAPRRPGRIVARATKSGYDHDEATLRVTR
ncbi:hypothetical protein [Nocardioides sp.]|uniref:hypothetical protein n=1 Tax=Nocardioides sp. TaxID=35761 RepID=UPI002D10B56D|nr:hypothetical protein [Nocardioides sp.]HXH80902.1 hypothetical protein [Nocardioides sp.]